MSSFYTTAFFYSGKNSELTIEVSRSSEDIKPFSIKLELDSSSIEFNLSRKDVVSLRDKIDNALLDS